MEGRRPGWSCDDIDDAEAGFDGNVFRIFDVWESEAQMKRFMDETLMPAVEKMMADNPTGPPPIRESTYELHDILPE